jgi:hypothetical protein
MDQACVPKYGQRAQHAKAKHVRGHHTILIRPWNLVGLATYSLLSVKEVALSHASVKMQ